MTVIRIPNKLPNGTYAIIHLSERPYLNLIKNMKTKGLLIATYCTCNMRQAHNQFQEGYKGNIKKNSCTLNTDFCKESMLYNNCCKSNYR
jgi:hypothetical protein